MGLKSLEDVTYFRLNNEINRPVNGQIMLHKDKEALDASLKKMLYQILKPLTRLQTRFSTFSSTITLRELLSRNTVLNF